MKSNMTLSDELAVVDWMKDHMRELIDTRPTTDQLLQMIITSNGGSFAKMEPTRSKVQRIAASLEENLGKSFLPGRSAGGRVQGVRTAKIIDLLCIEAVKAAQGKWTPAKEIVKRAESAFRLES